MSRFENGDWSKRARPSHRSLLFSQSLTAEGTAEKGRIHFQAPSSWVSCGGLVATLLDILRRPQSLSVISSFNSIIFVDGGPGLSSTETVLLS